MLRSTRLLIVLGIVAGILIACVPAAAVTWVQVGSTIAGPIATPDSTTVKYSAVQNMPSDFAVTGGQVPNMKVTYHLLVTGIEGWGHHVSGQGGLALYVGATPSWSIGIYTGVHYEAYTFHGALCSNIANSLAPVEVYPGGPYTAYEWDMIVEVVNGVAKTTMVGVNDQSFTISTTDISNWTGRLTWAAFKSAAASGDYNFEYGKAVLTNIAFYKDASQQPPAVGTVSGTVTRNLGSSHPAVQCALVSTSDGLVSVLTDSAGYYTLTLDPGTYTLNATKADCDVATVSNVVVTGNQNTPANFDLPTSHIVGKVTENLAGSLPIAGVKVWAADSSSYAITDSAGDYALLTTSGTHTIRAYGVGYLAGSTSASPGVNGTVTANIALDSGWDLASDFASTSNPNGVWSYKVTVGPRVDTMMDWCPPYPFNDGYEQSQVPSAIVWGPYWVEGVEWSNVPIFVSNYAETAYTSQSQVGHNPAFYRESKKLCATGGNVEGSNAVARFTAPTSGSFKVTARWAGQNVDASTYCGVALKYGNTYLFGDPATSPKVVDGFAGRAVNEYSDASGVSPVQTFSTTMDLHTGDTIDSIVSYPYSGWCQVDLTVTSADDIAVVRGRVTADNLPGHPAVINAKVVAMEGPGTYETRTDINGNYVMKIQPGAYILQAGGDGGYETSYIPINVATGTVLDHNFSITHSGTWDLSEDYNEMANPNGQWSYGYSETQDGVLRAYETLGAYTQPMKVWTHKDATAINGWYCWLGKNTTGAPVAWEAIARYDENNNPVIEKGGYVDNGEMTFGGGGGWFDSTPVGAVYPRIRWTSPDQRAVKITVVAKSQIPQLPNGGTAYISVAKNNSIIGSKVAKGFVGRAVSNYTDSIGPSPVVTYQTQLLVNANDTIDLMQGTLESTDLHRWINVFGYPWKSMGVSYVIEPSDGVVCNSIADVKSKAVGTTVFLSTPVALSCATNAFKDYTFFVQSDDRSIGMKCIGSADLPAYTADNKITFTGVIEAGPAGQPNVVRIQSINSAVTATAPNPLGVVGKNLSVTNAPLNRLIRVWGTLKSRNPTDIGPGPFDASTTTWPWNYWTISDGSQDIKVLMNVQSGWMCPPYIPDSPTWNIGVTYIGITGIATLDGTGQLVVMPLRDASIVSYTE